MPTVALSLTHAEDQESPAVLRKTKPTKSTLPKSSDSKLSQSIADSEQKPAQQRGRKSSKPVATPLATDDIAGDVLKELQELMKKHEAEMAEEETAAEETAGAGPLEPAITPDEVVALAEKEKGRDVRVLPLANKSDMAEYMVFVTGTSKRHLRTMADDLVRELRRRERDERAPAPGVEGRDCEDWMIVDAGDIIVHYMTAEARTRYKLERKWEMFNLQDALQGAADTEAVLKTEEEERELS